MSNNYRIKCINIIEEWNENDIRIVKDDQGKFLLKDGRIVVENVKKTKYKSLDTYYDVITLDLLKQLKLKNSILEYFELHFPYGLKLNDSSIILELLYKKHGVFLNILKKKLEIVIFL